MLMQPVMAAANTDFSVGFQNDITSAESMLRSGSAAAAQSNLPPVPTAIQPAQWAPGTSQALSGVLKVTDPENDPTALYVQVDSGGFMTANGKTYAPGTPLCVRASQYTDSSGRTYDLSNVLPSLGMDVITGTTLSDALSKVSVIANNGVTSLAMTYQAAAAYTANYPMDSIQWASPSAFHNTYKIYYDTAPTVTTLTPAKWTAGTLQSLSSLVSATDGDGDQVGLYVKATSNCWLNVGSQSYGPENPILVRPASATSMLSYGFPVVTGTTLADALSKVTVDTLSFASSVQLAYNATDGSQLSNPTGAKTATYALSSNVAPTITQKFPTSWLQGSSQQLANLFSATDPNGDTVGLYLQPISGATLTANGTTYSTGQAVLIEASSVNYPTFNFPTITGTSLTDAMSKVTINAASGTSQVQLAANAFDGADYSYPFGAKTFTFPLQTVGF